MKNELLTIGPFTVYGYGLMIGIGVIAAYLTAEMRAKKQGLDNGERVFSLVIWCVIGGILGAKLLYLITQYREILADPAEIRRDFGRLAVLPGAEVAVFEIL